MKFLKIKTSEIGSLKSTTEWYLEIDSLPDLLRYKNLDIGIQSETFLYMDQTILDSEKSKYLGHGVSANLNDSMQTTTLEKLPTRAVGIARMMALKMQTATENDRIYPLDVLADYIDKKAIGMAKCINRFGSILINKNGGYSCTEGYIKQWNAQILEKIEKTDLGFPVNDEPLNAQTIVLENAAIEDNIFNDISKEQFPNTSFGVITSLREVDQNYIYKCILNAENICIQTQAQNIEQVDAFVKLFANVKQNKSVLISTTEEGENTIRNHELFKKLTHLITFIKF